MVLPTAWTLAEVIYRRIVMVERLARPNWTLAASITMMLYLVGVSSMTALAAPGGQGHICHSRYAGPCFEGRPALEITASLIAAGGGGAHFSTVKALTAMLGARTAKAEVAKLSKQYGHDKTASWLAVFDFVVRDSLHIARNGGVKLPHGTLKGKALATALVETGLNQKTFYIEFLLDKMVSHRIHEKVMDGIDSRFGGRADANYHRISNQAMYDLAHALGYKYVKLCKFH
jgi:hypothetical protein